MRRRRSIIASVPAIGATEKPPRPIKRRGQWAPATSAGATALAYRRPPHTAADTAGCARKRAASRIGGAPNRRLYSRLNRSEEHTSELQSLMRISYAVFCLKKQNKNTKIQTPIK